LGSASLRHTTACLYFACSLQARTLLGRLRRAGGMKGKTCVITGATSGIGLEAAEALARRGAALILVGRDAARAEAARRRIAGRVTGAQVTFHLADLSRLAEQRRLAADLLAKAGRIDVLINNAGAFFDRHALTEDGWERTFALNHMSYFVLGNLLLPRLRETGAARIVNVASEAHRGATLDFSDLAGRRGAKGWPAYRRSKLANILFTAEFASRLGAGGVTVNCLHPGFVATRFGESGNTPMTRIALGLAKSFIAISPAEGARTIVHLASAPEVAAVRGRYFIKSREARPSPAAQDGAAAHRLWEESARLAGFAA
jgi:NAD(P)-dependent dehydrogenase (short-subunit alcohol dehydrogenase family)